MPTLSLYANGIVAAQDAHRKPRKPGQRSKVSGWSAGAARRNDLFLRSVDFAQIEKAGLHGFALTLTIPKAPPTVAEFKRRLRSFVKFMVKCQAVLLHYVIEMQPRLWSKDGPVPHVHMVAFFRAPYGPDLGAKYKNSIFSGGVPLIYFHWLGEAFGGYGCLGTAQKVEKINDAVGWARYVAKHGARGESHYQRLAELMPKGWESTGRLWGKVGDWPTISGRLILSDAAFYALRRFVGEVLLREAWRQVQFQKVRLADSANDKQEAQNKRDLERVRKRVRYLNKRLRGRGKETSRYVPVSDWVPRHVITQWLGSVCQGWERIDPETGEVLHTIHALRDEVEPQEWRDVSIDPEPSENDASG